MPTPPVPVELRRKLGNPQKRSLPDPKEAGTIEPAVQGRIPPPLRTLSPAGRKVWNHVLGMGATWMATTDLPLLQQVCEQIDEQQELRRVIKRPPKARVEGLWRDRLNLRRLDESIRKGMQDLGLSPTARTRLGVAQVVAAAIVEDTTTKQRERRGKMFDEKGLVEVVEHAPELTPPRKSWTKAKILAWFDVNEISIDSSLTRRELLAEAGVEL